MLREDERRQLTAARTQLSMRLNSPGRGDPDFRDKALLVLIDAALRQQDLRDVTAVHVGPLSEAAARELEHSGLFTPGEITALRAEPVMPLRTDEATVHHTADSLGRLATATPLPPGYHRTGEDCPDCGGSGVDAKLGVGRACRACLGSGQEIVPDE